MSEAGANAAPLRRDHEEVFNRRNLAFLREHLHPDVVGHGPGIEDDLRSIEQVAAPFACVFEASRRAFSGGTRGSRAPRP